MINRLKVCQKPVQKSRRDFWGRKNGTKIVIDLFAIAVIMSPVYKLSENFSGGE